MIEQFLIFPEMELSSLIFPEMELFGLIFFLYFRKKMSKPKK